MRVVLSAIWVTAVLRDKYKGRKREIDPAEINRLKSEGLGATEIARRLSIGRASVYRAFECA